MPTGEKFAFLGAGNGFPRCIDAAHPFLQRVDVGRPNNTYTHWTTLSGVTKDNYTTFSDEQLAEKVEESRLLAMRWFWNLHKAEMSVSMDYESGEDGHTNGSWSEHDPTAKYTIDDYNVTPTAESLLDVPPKIRTCIPRDQYTGGGIQYEYAGVQYTDEDAGRLEKMLSSAAINLLTVGDTVMGFSLGSASFASKFNCGLWAAAPNIEIGVGGYASSFPRTNTSTYYGYTWEADYVNIDGYDFVATISGMQYDQEGTRYELDEDGEIVEDENGDPIEITYPITATSTVSFSPLSVTCEQIYELEDAPDYEKYTTSISIDGNFEYYTYT